MVAFGSDIFNDPGVHSPIAIVLHLRFTLRGLQLHFAVLRNVNLKTVFIDDHSLREGVFVPEVPRREGCHDARDCLIFQNIARLERGHRDVPLPVVAVHRSFFQNVRSEILGGRVRCHDHLSAWLSYPDVFDLQLLGRRRVTKYQLPELLNASLTLNPNDRFSLFHAGAVVFKARAIEDALEYGSLLGVVCFRRRWGLGLSTDDRQSHD